MRFRLRSRAGFFGGLAFLALLPLLAHAFAGGAADRCARDGVAIEAAYAVRVRTPDGASRRFCGVACARRWLATRDDASRVEVFVIDEGGGGEIRAEDAWFVRSVVVAPPAPADGVHAFATRAAATAHAKAYRGTVLTGAARPFPSGPPRSSPAPSPEAPPQASPASRPDAGSSE